VSEEIVVDAGVVPLPGQDHPEVVLSLGVADRVGFLDRAPLDRHVPRAGEVHVLVAAPRAGDVVQDQPVNVSQLQAVVVLPALDTRLRPLTRASRAGKGSEPFAWEPTDHQVYGLSAGPAVLERTLPLPGLSRRLALLIVNEPNGQSALRRANQTRPVARQTPAQVVRAAVVAAAVAAQEDVHVRGHAALEYMHERRRVSRVWPAMVRLECRMVMLPRMTPLTAKTTIRGPLAAQASWRLPGPDGFSVVTLITRPPWRPRAVAPKPSARGKAASGSAACAKVQQTKPARTAPLTLALAGGRQPLMDPHRPCRPM